MYIYIYIHTYIHMHIHMYVCNGYFGTCSCRIITSYMQWSTSPAEQHVFSSSSVCAHPSSLPPGSRPLHFGENTIAGPEQTAHSHTIFVYLTSASMTSWIWMVRIMQRVAFTPVTKRPACIRSISTVAIKGVQNRTFLQVEALMRRCGKHAIPVFWGQGGGLQPKWRGAR